MRVLGAPVWALFRFGMARFLPADPGRLHAVGIGGGGGGGGGAGHPAMWGGASLLTSPWTVILTTLI